MIAVYAFLQYLNKMDYFFFFIVAIYDALIRCYISAYSSKLCSLLKKTSIKLGSCEDISIKIPNNAPKKNKIKIKN